MKTFIWSPPKPLLCNRFCRFFAACRSHGTTRPCWSARNSLGQDKCTPFVCLVALFFPALELCDWCHSIDQLQWGCGVEHEKLGAVGDVAIGIKGSLRICRESRLNKLLSTVWPITWHKKCRKLTLWKCFFQSHGFSYLQFSLTHFFLWLITPFQDPVRDKPKESLVGD